jgi:hypothetical protein
MRDEQTKVEPWPGGSLGVVAVSTADVPIGRHAARANARTQVPAIAWISWVALALMTTSSVASLRPAPTMAVYGLAGWYRPNSCRSPPA